MSLTECVRRKREKLNEVVFFGFIAGGIWFEDYR